MSNTEPPPPPEAIGEADEIEPPAGRRALLIAASLVVAVLVAVVIAVLVADDEVAAPTTAPDTSGRVTTDSTVATSSIVPVASSVPSTTLPATTLPATTVTPTSSVPSTTTAATTSVPTSTTTTPAAPTTTVAPADLTSALWPDPGAGRGYTDPAVLAADFSTEFLGFVDPLFGDFDGDQRSGEVAVRAPEGSAGDTLVVVQRLGDDGLWWVIDAAADDIVVDQPIAGDLVASPLTLDGQARAFEGTVQVALWVDGRTQPIAETFVTGSGDPELGPFSGTLPFDARGAGRGIVLFRSESPEDGSTVAATAVRVTFS